MSHRHGQRQTDRHTAHSLLALPLEFLYHNPSIPVFIGQRLQIFPRAHSILDSILLLTWLRCFPSFSRLWHTDHAPASGFHVHADMYHPILIVLFAPCLFPLKLLLKLNEVIQKTTLREKDPCTSLSITKPPLHPLWASISWTWMNTLYFLLILSPVFLT